MAEKIGLHPRDISINNHADYLHAAFGDHVNDKVVEGLVMAANSVSPALFTNALEYWLPGAGQKALEHMGRDPSFISTFSAEPKKVFPVLQHMAFFTPTVEERYVHAIVEDNGAVFQDTVVRYLQSGEVAGWLDLGELFAPYFPQGEFSANAVRDTDYGINWKLAPATNDAHEVFGIIEDTLIYFKNQSEVPSKQSFGNILNAINEVYDKHPRFHPLLQYDSPGLGQGWTEVAEKGIYHPSAIPAEHTPQLAEKPRGVVFPEIH